MPFSIHCVMQIEADPFTTQTQDGGVGPMRDDSFTPDDVAPMRFPFQGDSIDNSKDPTNNKFNMLQH